MSIPTPATPSSPRPRSTIRPARTDDPAEVDRLYEICRRTGRSGEDASAVTAHPRLLGDVYLGAYLRFEPDLALVLVDPAGTVVGYVLGARDTAAFDALLEREWWPVLRERYPLGCAPEGSFDAGVVQVVHGEHGTDPAVLADYPAHLHVDLLPEGQGGGDGRRLLEALFDALRAREVPGVHLGVSLDNTRAIGFYTHLGFTVLGEGGWQLGLDLRPVTCPTTPRRPG